MNDKNYKERCLRAIGIMDETQLNQIKNTTVAIGGLGLGGSIFINLVRLGFEKFHLADPDIYERTNINRQRAAKETTINCRKDDCLIQEARSINPDLDLKLFREGVNQKNCSAFLTGVDWIVDAVDIFAMSEKIALHEEARKLKLPIVSCVSVGFGAAVVVFDHEPSSPSFLELTTMKIGESYEYNIKRFVRFATPEIPQYMEAQLNKALTRTSHIPFVVCGVEISAAVACTEICKSILKLGESVKAPMGIYIDPVDFKFEKFNSTVPKNL